MKVKDLIFEKIFSGAPSRVIRRSDFPDELLPDDIIVINREDGFYSENNSWDGETRIQILREREQTEEEKEEFRNFLAERREQLKKERYQEYLKLKKEFEI